MVDGKLVTLGTSLIVVAVTPTPDDVTIISPLLQFAVGTGLIIYGIAKKNNR